MIEPCDTRDRPLAPMETIASRQNRLVREFRAAARGESPDDLLLLDGDHLVREAHRSGVELVVAAFTEALTSRNPEARQLAAALTSTGCRIVEVTPSVMGAMSPTTTPSGCVALAKRPSAPRDAMLNGPTPFVLAVSDVQDPGNVGAIVRVAEGGGASGIMTLGASADPFGWKALRGSMGSAFRLPVLRERNAHEAIQRLKAHGLRVVATTPRAPHSLFEYDLKRPMMVLLGGEGSGLPATLISESDDQVSIPMQSPIESLNVATAAAIVIYEAYRQRHASSSAASMVVTASAARGQL